ncbi:reverse transcriptase-like protein [Virgibacillus sp. NKC19-16]|uniref:reverse transcriptase-like protein n=1 Tax=Virgibacillus salidurans TaxID=2831673 RepID=UPI001F34A4FD|nr:reverse transcriptase-like protein [Virgibacillus sp. NKC19-16]UJL47268.1 reverse transcriptase-like protein [Virgibacillus sp. NKC19-16]
MQVRIEITYQTPKGAETAFTSDQMYAPKALLFAEDLEKTGRMKNIQFIDTRETTWNFKQLKKQLEEIKTEPHNVTVFFDGGFDLETRKSGLGCAIYYEQNKKSFRLRKNALVEELDTNNEAEYAALHLAIKELELLGVHHLPVTVVGDSQVVINQLKEDWPCYEKELAKWADRIENKIAQLGIEAAYELVSRKKNREADHLASQALKEIEIISTKEIDY